MSVARLHDRLSSVASFCFRVGTATRQPEWPFELPTCRLSAIAPVRSRSLDPWYTGSPMFVRCRCFMIVLSDNDSARFRKLFISIVLPPAAKTSRLCQGAKQSRPSRLNNFESRRETQPSTHWSPQRGDVTQGPRTKPTRLPRPRPYMPRPRSSPSLRAHDSSLLLTLHRALRPSTHSSASSAMTQPQSCPDVLIRAPTQSSCWIPMLSAALLMGRTRSSSCVQCRDPLSQSNAVPVSTGWYAR